jgi:arsenate reductase-like glutaredoxin family protein
MKKIYHLSSCSTCQWIIKEINPDNSVDLQDIKVQNIDASMLDWIKDKVGSYEALFSKRAMKFRAMGLHEQQLTDDDYRRLMLEEYTFLKRPFIILGDQVFIGNAKKDVEAAVKAFHS